MKVSKDMVVALSYELEVEGQIADKASKESPLEYIQGTGMLLPKFETEVDGKVPGDSFEFTLSPEEGYGAYNPEYRIQIPIEAFSIDGEVQKEFLVPGRTLPMLDGEGQVIQGTVLEVLADKVTMDFNHPMAGKTLHFTGTVVSVREATSKELAEGLHGEFLPSEECGCHGGCHGDCDHGDCGGGDCHHGECGGGHKCHCKE